MRKLFKLLVILFLFYIGIQFVIKYFGSGHDIEYRLKHNDKEILIKEIYTNKKEFSNYYFEVMVDSKKFVFQTYKDFKKADMIIKDFRYFEDQSNSCFLPIFRNEKIIIDFMCYQDNIIYLYNSNRINNKNFEDFVTNIDVKYTKDQFIDNEIPKDEDDLMIKSYPGNVLDNHFVYVNNYKGLLTINNENLRKVANVQLFNKDNYKKRIETLVENNYITVDYNQDFNFRNFNVVDITSNEKMTITSTNQISFNSYFQGYVDKFLYLFDRENEVQYRIDIKNKKIIIVGDKEIGIKHYENNEWQMLNVSEYKTIEKKFGYQNVEINESGYARIDVVKNDNNSYVYYYKNVNGVFDVYRASTKNLDQKIMLGSINSIDSINYYKDYFYFKEGNNIKYYHDSKGFRNILFNPEFEFNSDISYGIYIAK